jgi:hypothetical protein
VVVVRSEFYLLEVVLDGFAASFLGRVTADAQHAQQEANRPDTHG